MCSQSDLNHDGFVMKGSYANTPEQMISDYTEWSKQYEQDCVNHEYMGHLHIANKMSELFDTDSRSTTRVIDVAAGTGFVGKQLKEVGFTDIDALDPVEAMLEEAKKRGIYNNYFYEFMTEKPLDIKENTYDALVGSGLFGHSYIPMEAIREMARLVKPDGHIVVCFNSIIIDDQEEYKEYTQLDSFMKQLESEGVMLIASREHFPQFYRGKEAELLHFQVL